MKLLPLALVAALAACSPPADPAANQAEPANDMAAPAAAPPPSAAPNETAAVVPSRKTALTAEGWGPLRIGMTRAEIETALGKDADPGAVGGPDPASCDQFRPERAPENMLVMVEDGRLTRISLVRDSTIATDRGVRLGDGAAKVRMAYGDALKSEPHAYAAPEGGYLTAWAKAGGADARGIRYEINPDDLVSAIHAGGPAITYVEGCL